MSQTLLLADDSVTIQRVIELTFADEDVNVIAVGDGRQAIDRIMAEPPDIVLADTGMPERDGYEVSAFVKGDPALAHIPVVLLTGAFEPVDGERARRAGCDAVLVKPFEPQIVIRRVRELLDGPSSSVPPAAESVANTATSTDRLTAAGDTREEDDEGSLNRVAEAPVELSQLDSELPPDQTTSSATIDEGAAPGSTPESTAIPADDPLGAQLERLDEVFEGRVTASATETRPVAVNADLEALSPEPASTTGDSRVDSLDGALNVLEGAFEQLDLDDFEKRAQGRRSSREVPALTLEDTTPELVPSRAEEGDLVGSTVDFPEALTTPPPAVPAPVGPGIRESAVSSRVPESGQDTVTPVPLGAASPPPSLADAFASLLAAEQGDLDRARAAYPWPKPAVFGHFDTSDFADALVDRVTERVIERLSAGVTGELVAEVVSRVAERLVREEIERIKQV